MGYSFRSLSGIANLHGFIDTVEGWVPYWNLQGRYVGLKYPVRYNKTVVYYNPSRNVFVSTYEELDW